ncbi:TlpA family protein disulfide reductase [Roseivirga thermotolerans]|uniref:Thioredoxin domain-containing protein n=1 Tax=Roseivirga thermotolerans TaxID=1758176 RepID=A0ABQ3I7N2_9BACT|nr:TlpA disulfide reductase family protein [Roseivirga thermotolerans]GHE71440.1 hypothetical protein GCM10011340_29280 [Roseivirga thermotolerans]
MIKYILCIAALFVWALRLNAQTAASNLAKKASSIDEGYVFPDNAWLISVNGDTITFGSLKGTWIILDYWTAGCKPCVEAFPFLQALNNENPKKLTVVAINVDKSFDRFSKYHQKYSIGYPNYFSGFSLSNPFMLANLQPAHTQSGEVRMTTLTPQYILIDPEGRIINKNLPKPGSIAFQQALSIIKQ